LALKNCRNGRSNQSGYPNFGPEHEDIQWRLNAKYRASACGGYETIDFSGGQSYNGRDDAELLQKVEANNFAKLTNAIKCKKRCA
jgi:hypothetical protein